MTDYQALLKAGYGHLAAAQIIADHKKGDKAAAMAIADARLKIIMRPL